MLMVTMLKKFSYKRFIVSLTEFSHHISEPVAERWLRGSCECEALFRKKKHFGVGSTFLAYSNLIVIIRFKLERKRQTKRYNFDF